MELAGTDLDIVVLEAGGKRTAGTSQRLYAGSVADPLRQVPLDRGRSRGLGGTTALWGGRCIPFDDIDFATRDYVPFSGWPMTRQELDGYYRRAHYYCQCGAPEYLVENALPDAPNDMIAGLENGVLVTSTLERWSPPTRFGKTYSPHLKRARSLRVLLNALALDVDLSEERRRVSRVAVSSLGRNRFEVHARCTVLAGGALEVTRLLLHSRALHLSRAAQDFGWLGRGYMSHVQGVVAQVTINQPRAVIVGYETDRDGVYCRRRLSLSETAQRQHRLLNIYALLDRPWLEDPEHGSAILSLAFLAKRLAKRQGVESLGRGKLGLYRWHIQNVLAGAPEVLSFLPTFGRQRFLNARRLPSLLLKSKSNRYHLYYHQEQSPNPDSRVTLSKETDDFGISRLHVDQRINQDDIDSVYRAHLLIDHELRRQECGYLSFSDPDPIESIQQHPTVIGHHIGTTRMADDASMGVVDKTCRVHGLSNLFIASSSVFPTSSQANPTLTIIALAIRLADHLKQNLDNL